ncbi:MAG: copper amine oxidase N-terminal domain-containing protein [Defluviitaleaceae bacterium]|nr:copper amine oxidase N-terminal domain-containing protein [Defluviitaleaceae bacterium]
MRRKFYLGLLLMLLVMALNAATAMANAPRVTLDGEHVDVEASLVDGRTLLPARAIVELVGGDVDWNPELRQVTITHGSTNILLTVDNQTAYVNGVAEILDVPPQVIEGRTKVPLRFIGVNLGMEIEFSGATVNLISTQDITIPVATIQPETQPAVNPLALSNYFDGRAFSTRQHELSDGTVLNVHITSVVRRNEDAIVRFDWQPGDDFYLRIRYASGYGTAAGLGSQTTNEQGFISWRWRVGGRTALGTYPITITGNGESIRLYLTVIES